MRLSLTRFTIFMALFIAAVRPASAALFSKMSDDDEIKAGKQIAAQSIRQYGGVLPYNHPMSVRVRTIGMQIAALSTRKNIPFSYQVLNNEKVLNAFAAPGGPVFVTRKLVETTSNDAELAYVLGHETGHIEKRHIVQQIQKEQQVGLVAGVIGMLFGGGRNGDLINATTNVTYSLWDNGYSRKHESEADAVGVRFMVQLGYDPRAAVTMLGKLGSGSSGLGQYLSTHPNPDARQRDVNKEIADESLLDAAAQHGGPKLWFNSGGPGNWGEGALATGPLTEPTPTTGNTELNLGAPLVLADSGDYRVIMAPVAGIAHWARADLRTRGDSIILQRGDSSVEVKERSTQAVINGRTVDLTAPAQSYNGQLYAPIGSLVEGIGGSTRLDQTNMIVWITLKNGPRGFVKVP